MEVRYARHAVVDAMPDEKISKQEVEATIRNAELRAKISENKFKFRFRDLEMICARTRGY